MLGAGGSLLHFAQAGSGTVGRQKGQRQQGRLAPMADVVQHAGASVFCIVPQTNTCCGGQLSHEITFLSASQATTITMQHLRHRLPEVVAAVAQRLVGVGRIAAAADLQEGMNDVQGEHNDTGSGCINQLLVK